MISRKMYTKKLKFAQTLKSIWLSEGLRGLYAGVLPRTVWMAFGGLIFFGAYETIKGTFIQVDIMSTFHNGTGVSQF